MKHAFTTVALLLLANSASAAVIDFTSSDADALNGKASEHVVLDGVGLTVSAEPSPDATIVKSSQGLGVNDGKDGYFAGKQIEGDEELLTVTFDDVQLVTGFTVTNLFDWGRIQIEVGEYTIDGTNYNQFVAENLDGTLAIDLGSVSATSVSFRAVDGWSWFGDSGFTLQSITTEPDAVASVTAVPELDPSAMPGALAVLAGSALVLSERRRERS